MGSQKKFKELVLYIASRSEKDENFGSVKLNKLLFYSDFLHYGHYGSSITGAEYKRDKLGPVPQNIERLKKSMQQNQECAIKQRYHFGQIQNRLIALREPDLSVFTGQEIGIVNDVIEVCKDLNATDISELSHEFMGWRIANHKETIPYSTVFISDRPLTQDEIDYGLGLQ